MDDVIELKLNSYPATVKAEMLELRELIFSIARAESLGPISESIKWGQLSFSAPNGSPIRVDWNLATPLDLSLFFHCQTKLVATFKEVYPNCFTYIGNRQLMLPLNDASKYRVLSHCLTVALKYHLVKDKPLLGL